MGSHSHGLRKKTRRKFSKGVREKFKPEDYLRPFSEGQNVIIAPDPASQKSLPHSRFKGKTGKVKEKRGRGYVVEVFDGHKKKIVMTKPEHLRPAG